MSIFDHAGAIPTPPSWRCPHCRTLQPETTRCWACARPTVSCATCHLFRRSVAGNLGYCANDASRTPLDGEEVRSCWVSAEDFVMAAPGLFSAQDLTVGSAPEPVAESSSVPSEPVTAANPGPREGGLVDAPMVEPGRHLMSELRRRSQGRRTS